MVSYFSFIDNGGTSFTIRTKMNFLDHQQLKPHCHKCGRRSRNHKHNYRQQCLFPNENYSIPKNILIDQLIQVQQLNGKTLREPINSNRIQQMIYLRENINK